MVPNGGPSREGSRVSEGWTQIKVITVHCVRDELGSSVWLRWLIGSWLQDCQYKKPWFIETRGTAWYKHNEPRTISSLSHKNTVYTQAWNYALVPTLWLTYTCTHIRHAMATFTYEHIHMLRLYKHKHASLTVEHLLVVGRILVPTNTTARSQPCPGLHLHTVRSQEETDWSF